MQKSLKFKKAKLLKQSIFIDKVYNKIASYKKSENNCEIYNLQKKSCHTEMSFLMFISRGESEKGLSIII